MSRYYTCVLSTDSKSGLEQSRIKEAGGNQQLDYLQSEEDKDKEEELEK